MRTRAVLPLCAWLFAGCAYYNSMYYANRYAAEAERSERAGRDAEARERWRQAAVHAESLLARHPGSKWADDAMLVRGKAYLHLRSWSEAVVYLQLAVAQAPNDAQRRTAQLYLGEANFGLRRLPQALEQLDDAVGHRDARVRSRAYLVRGQVLLAMGRPADALEDLARSRERGARVEQTRAALAVGDVPLAEAYADTMAGPDVPFVEGEWAPLLDTLARLGLAERASVLVARLAARDDAGRGARSRLLLAEGDRRLAAGQDSAAARQFRAVQQLVPDSVEARAAWIRLTRIEVRGIEDAAGLDRIRQRLALIVSLGGEPARAAQDLSRALQMTDLLAASDSTPDAFAFLRAELLRDSVGARALACRAFADVAERFPASPWAPKALIAAIAGGHPAADSLRALLAGRYAATPYAAVALGRPGAAERFAVLEDSLRAILRLAPTAQNLPDRPVQAPGLLAPGVNAPAGVPIGVPTGVPANPNTPREERPVRGRNPDP